MTDSAPASPIPSPPRAQSNEHGLRCRATVPPALPQWNVAAAAKIAVKAFRPGTELDESTLEVVSTACSQLVVACASVALATGPAGSTATLTTVERAVSSLMWRPRTAGWKEPHSTLVRRGQVQARAMATKCSGAVALQPELTEMLVDVARQALSAKRERSCERCDEQAIAYLGAIADFVCSELLTAAVGQAEQECCQHVLPCHLNAALVADRELSGAALNSCFGRLEVGRQPVPFCRARFGSYDGPIRDCPMVVFEDDEELDECVFGAVAVVRLSDNPACSFASRALDAQRAGAIALILICSDDMLFEPTCRASESEGLTIPVAIVAHCDRSLFADDRTISLSLNPHCLAMYGQQSRLSKARDDAAPDSWSTESVAAPPPRISPVVPDAKLDVGRRHAKRAAFFPVSVDQHSSSEPSETTTAHLSKVRNGKRAKQSELDGFSLPSIVPKAAPTSLSCSTST